eukprot:351933-Chlamydomonas_euryale.AAC.1
MRGRAKGVELRSSTPETCVRTAWEQNAGRWGAGSPASGVQAARPLGCRQPGRWGAGSPAAGVQAARPLGCRQPSLPPPHSALKGIHNALRGRRLAPAMAARALRDAQ